MVLVELADIVIPEVWDSVPASQVTLMQVACEFHFDKIALTVFFWMNSHSYIHHQIWFAICCYYFRHFSQVASFLYILFLKSKSSIPPFHTHQVPIGFPSTSPCQKLVSLTCVSTHSPSRLSSHCSSGIDHKSRWGAPNTYSHGSPQLSHQGMDTGHTSFCFRYTSLRVSFLTLFQPHPLNNSWIPVWRQELWFSCSLLYLSTKHKASYILGTSWLFVDKWMNKLTRVTKKKETQEKKLQNIYTLLHNRLENMETITFGAKQGT